MITLTIDERRFVQSVNSFSNKFKRNSIDALDQIRVKWQAQMVREQMRGTNGGWPPLSEAYAKRKEREQPGRPMLTLSGIMMRNYLGGIRTDPYNTAVYVQLPGTPGSPVRRRAEVHQFTSEPSKRRPFPVDKTGLQEFARIARAEFVEAVNKTLNG